MSEDIYTFRHLQDNEVDAFLNHLVSVFSSRPGGVPKGLFADHFLNDPDRDLEGIRVAVHPGNALKKDEIVGTVRVYRRTLNLGPFGKLSCGAIGDVGTSPAHGGKGIASRLMREAEAYMIDRGISVAVLHTGSAAKLYAKLGWCTCPMRMSTLSFEIGELKIGVEKWMRYARPVNVERRADVSLMRLLHEKFAPVGSFVRSEAYWREWVSADPQDTRRKLVRHVLEASVDGKVVQAYMFLDISTLAVQQLLTSGKAETPVVSTVREFFVGRVEGGTVSTVPREQFVGIFGALLLAGVNTIFDESIIVDSMQLKVTFPAILMPEAAMDAIRDADLYDWLAPQKRVFYEDLGWMWKVLRPFELVSHEETCTITSNEELVQKLKNPISILSINSGPINPYGFLKTDDF
ncbi:uncharacterized protein SPPG_03646 [Spizellomyces punctatus DAOM BR117]|uniref:N-acetyltransferase domain-containing protein n=1 Tax=Spizellomyces punctatus (strain DAOM BR117) TaxID=645134 RepID=A0A0L0HK67_SPIPD|nr:uncharacterized protein SPPG_03646 [Spizellomyces punctatus DAOM BR117]KND01856.1 hypothetical protein SPPG_03646 [Spizellomyces punctatus DAOM BR117]|eukprot:XP_016609895.1 hypothetical protein SPPG_03646 [Spizellomyces punctatus DAOM BR117]